MNPRLARWLTRLYPRTWRERYGAEFAAHLETGPGGALSAFDVVRSVVIEHLAPTVQAEGSRLSGWQAWCVQSPWVVFGVAPWLSLAAAYFAACLILWLGWRMLLPGSSTPFVPVHGIAVVYFGLGRALYFAAPVLVGWGLVLVAVRRRLSAVWLAPSLILLAWVASAIRVQARISSASQGGGDISIGFFFRDLSRLPDAAMILLLTLPLYFALRAWIVRARSV
jgi:hypothetical protein